MSRVVNDGCRFGPSEALSSVTAYILYFVKKFSPGTIRRYSSSALDTEITPLSTIGEENCGPVPKTDALSVAPSYPSYGLPSVTAKYTFPASVSLNTN